MIWLGLLTAAAGTTLLWFAWRAGRDRRAGTRIALRVAGWGLLAASLWPWTVAGGADRGVALALLPMMLTALVIVGAIGWRHYRDGRESNSRRRRPAGDKPATPASEGRLLRRIWIFLLAGPVAGLAALQLTVSLNALGASLAPPNRVALGLVLMPLAWCVLAIIATYDTRLRYRSSFLLACLSLGLAGVWLLPGGPV